MIHLRATASSAGSTQQADLVWPSLRQGIAKSSGFKRWVLERGLSEQEDKSNTLDYLVRLYLRQALETLAY